MARLTVYDTATFNVKSTVDDLGSALACQSNHNGKYAYVLTSPSRITIVNLLDPTERLFVENQDGGISGIGGIFSHVDERDFLLYNTSNALVYSDVPGLTPYYNKMMSSEAQ